MAGYALYTKEGFTILRELASDLSKWGATKTFYLWPMIWEDQGTNIVAVSPT